jgi:hypothetical protein
MRFRFPFRRDNRRPDGFWDAPDATDDNIKGTSVDPYDPVWPRWKQTPPDHGEGEFISEQPFFDIDEIMQRAEFYPPGRALVDKNLGGNPASRQRVGDMPGGNLSRRRLLVPRSDNSDGWPPARMAPESEGPLVLAQAIPRNADGTWPAPEATEENIKGTSVDRENPVWPRWTQTPLPSQSRPPFISDEPFYVIDELKGTTTLYPPGTPLDDINQEGEPLRRRRQNETPAGNLWRQRLNVWRGS